MTDTDSNIKIREHYSAIGFTERIKAAPTTIPIQPLDEETGRPQGAPRRLTDWIGFYFGNPELTADGNPRWHRDREHAVPWDERAPKCPT